MNGDEISFFTGKGGSGIIRGKQVSEYIGARLNPADGYENDICIYVKKEPPANAPPRTYLDIVDAIIRFPYLKRHPRIGIIAVSKTAYMYLRERYPDHHIVLIPEHHCNFDRVLRVRDEVRVVGVAGHPMSIQYDGEELKRMLAAIGLDYRPVFKKDFSGNGEVVRYYKGIDIQVVWRPRYLEGGSSQRELHLHNPLKVVNAGSFGIPTVSLPEKNMVDELRGYFIAVNTIDELISECERLKEDHEYYLHYSLLARSISENYHIEHISKRYLRLGDHIWTA